jgi:uncharacterized coiled-coil protein SlyX
MDSEYRNRQAAPPPNRFNTGHYTEFAQHHADVMEAMQNELCAAHTQIAQQGATIARMEQEVASLQALHDEQQDELRRLRHPTPTPNDGS